MGINNKTKTMEVGLNNGCTTIANHFYTPRKAKQMNSKPAAFLISKPFVFVLFFVGFYLFFTGNASASVFKNATRWPTDSDGITRITVCIVPESSVEQKGGREKKDIIHDTNPSLNDVIQHVRYALSTSWEKYSSIRFIGWRFCNELSTTERQAAAGLYITPDANNHSSVGTDGQGKTSKEDYASSFIPWGTGGDKTWCIYYNWGTTHMEYHYECVEQYAIHEFGHLIGFLHEWQHPARPASCVNRPSDEGVVPQGSYATSYSNRKWYTINYPEVYDWESIMTYDSECAGVTGVRFGSENLSSWDIENVRQIYPRPQRRSNGPISKLPVAVAEEMKWMAWNAAWYTANSRMGSAADARKSETAFNYHSEKMKNNAMNLAVSPQTLENIRWFAYNAAWSTANGRVGYNADADQARERAEQHFQAAKNSGELTNELLESIHQMGWSAAWHAANYLKGYGEDANRDKNAFEAAYQQIVAMR